MLCLWQRGQKVKVLHLADLYDLGLQVHQVESQTVFELPSVTINIGDVRVGKTYLRELSIPVSSLCRTPKPAPHPELPLGGRLGDKTSLRSRAHPGMEP